jgi:hypothetical protein
MGCCHYCCCLVGCVRSSLLGRDYEYTPTQVYFVGQERVLDSRRLLSRRNLRKNCTRKRQGAWEGWMDENHHPTTTNHNNDDPFCLMGGGIQRVEWPSTTKWVESADCFCWNDDESTSLDRWSGTKRRNHQRDVSTLVDPLQRMRRKCTRSYVVVTYWSSTEAWCCEAGLTCDEDVVPRSSDNNPGICCLGDETEIVEVGLWNCLMSNSQWGLYWRLNGVVATDMWVDYYCFLSFMAKLCQRQFSFFLIWMVFKAICRK